MDREQRPIRLLLVEDSEDDAELIRQELTRAGMAYESRRVDTRDALSDALVSLEWDIVLSDFAMPGFDGIEAFRMVSATESDIPFVFVSGAIGEERAVAAMREGARDYVLKDNLRRLPAVVHRELDEFEARRRRQLAEEAARREERRLAMAVEASGAGIFEFVLSGDGESHLSERFAAILGFSRHDLPAAASEPHLGPAIEAGLRVRYHALPTLRRAVTGHCRCDGPRGDSQDPRPCPSTGPAGMAPHPEAVRDLMSRD